MNDKADAQEPAYSGNQMLEIMQEAIRYNRFIERLIERWARSLTAKSRVVDFGAGIGTFTGVLAGTGAEILAIESDAHQGKVLSEAGYTVKLLSDIADSSVDYIYSINVIEHIDDDVSILREFRRILKPGGYVLIYVPAFQLLWTENDVLVGHCRRYRMKSLKTLVASGGISVDRCRYVDSAGFFAVLFFKYIVGNKTGGVLPRRSLILFDRVFFPIGRLLDQLGFGLLLGKNLFVVAQKPASNKG